MVPILTKNPGLPIDAIISDYALFNHRENLITKSGFAKFWNFKQFTEVSKQNNTSDRFKKSHWIVAKITVYTQTVILATFLTMWLWLLFFFPCASNNQQGHFSKGYASNILTSSLNTFLLFLSVMIWKFDISTTCQIFSVI